MNQPNRTITESSIVIRKTNGREQTFDLPALPVFDESSELTPEQQQEAIAAVEAERTAISEQALALWQTEFHTWKQANAMSDLYRMLKQVDNLIENIAALLPVVSQKVAANGLEEIILAADPDSFFMETPMLGSEWYLAFLAFGALETFLNAPLGEGLPSINDLTAQI